MTTSSPSIVEASINVPGTVSILDFVPEAQVNLVKECVGGSVIVDFVCDSSQSVKVRVVGTTVVGK